MAESDSINEDYFHAFRLFARLSALGAIFGSPTEDKVNSLGLPIQFTPTLATQGAHVDTTSYNMEIQMPQNTKNVYESPYLVTTLAITDDYSYLVYVAARTNNVTEIMKLKQAGANLNESLCIAALYGNVVAIKTLLESGANVNTAIDDGTPLYIAAINNRLEAVKVLLEAGANANLVAESAHGTALNRVRQFSTALPTDPIREKILEVLKKHHEQYPDGCKQFPTLPKTSSRLEF